ncbi:APC family permease [Domibacillus enclensis]|uniref:Amino acid permease n=1 Tax=Domibacillus enclensis TaxID=1017273 RepID=A0A1N6WVY3_9BACI|nr:APC family permease [Domibacillus enclensis]OXS78047.1 amino acid permease [Domibacillus enclensis]SIQ94175.1 amino acid/polyamine/organocation transporter, APC superfamily [Domibacillus enclensis]
MKQDQNLKKVLSTVDILFLAFGAMIGWGWVVLSGTWVQEAGTAGAIIAFIIGGIMVMFVGLTYAELASAMPTAGGALSYVLRGVGPKAAFAASWALALGYISVVAFEAVALPTVIEYIFPNYKVGYMYSIMEYDVYLSWVLVGVAGSIFVTVTNLFGIKSAAMLQMVLTIVIALIGLMLIFGAGINGEIANAQPLFVNGTAGIITVLVMTPFLFVGFDVIPQTAEEMNVKPKSIGKLLVFSVSLAIVWYVAIVYAVGVALDKEALASSVLPTADAMAAVFGSQLFASVLILGGVAGIITSWNAFIIGGSRVLYAMAEKKMIPAWFGKLHPKYNTPTNAILFIGLLATVSPLLGRPMLVWLVDAGGLAIVIAYFIVAIAFVQLRKKEPDMPRPFRAGKSSVVGWMAIILSLGFISLYLPGMPAALIWPYEWVIFAGWWLIGFALMFKMKDSYSNKAIQYTDVFEEPEQKIRNG